MTEDELIDSMIVDDFTPIIHALEKINGEKEERGSKDGLQARTD